MHSSLQLPYFYTRVVVRYQRKVTKCFGEVASSTPRASLHASFVQRSRQQYHAAKELPLETSSRQPRLLQHLVGVPEIASLDEGDGFAQRVVGGHAGSICLVGTQLGSNWRAVT